MIKTPQVSQIPLWNIHRNTGMQMFSMIELAVIAAVAFAVIKLGPMLGMTAGA